MNVHHYGDGIKARVFDKFMLKHHKSCSVLGLIYSAYEIKIENFISIVPNYMAEFGVGCSIEKVNDRICVGDVPLTEYEHEVCFLFVLGLDTKQMADFMNKNRPTKIHRVANTIEKCKNRICDKLGMDNNRLSNIRELLIHLGMHQKMPISFFRKMIGSRSL